MALAAFTQNQKGLTYQQAVPRHRIGLSVQEPGRLPVSQSRLILLRFAVQHLDNLQSLNV